MEVPGADRTVSCEGGGDHRTISDAIAAATSGETVAVGPCEYEESLDFAGKTLALVSTDGAEDTVLKASRGGAAIALSDGEGDGSLLSGFTIDGGGGYGAVQATLTSVRIEDSVLTGGSGYAAVYGDSADIELSGVVFEDNTNSQAVIWLDRGTLIADTVSVDCGRSMGLYIGHAALFIDHTDIVCGRNTALYTEHSVGRVLRTTMEGNLTMEQEDSHPEDTVALEDDIIDGDITQLYGSFQLRNSIVDGNITLTTVSSSSAIQSSVLQNATTAITADTSDFLVRNTVFWNNTTNASNGMTYVGDDDNFSEDPKFTDPDGGDYTLQPRSPLEDAGVDEDGWEDPDGSRNDIGAYGGPHSMGGGW